jgi:hypothetical protein
MYLPGYVTSKFVFWTYLQFAHKTLSRLHTKNARTVGVPACTFLGTYLGAYLGTNTILEVSTKLQTFVFTSGTDSFIYFFNKQHCDVFPKKA